MKSAHGHPLRSFRLALLGAAGGTQPRVVVPDMECAPCHQKGCEGSGTSLCLDTLEVAQVRTVIREALSG